MEEFNIPPPYILSWRVENEFCDIYTNFIRMDDLNKVTPHTYLPKYFIDKYGAELNGNKYNKIFVGRKEEVGGSI